MHRLIARVAVATLALTLAGFAPVTAATTNATAAKQKASKPAKAKRNKVIFSVTDNDKAKWNLAINNAAAVQKNVGAKDIDVEIVVWGPGINMLKIESPVGNRVDELIDNGIKVVACQTTMHDMKLSPEDMLAKAGYVRGGVIELMEKQQQGWAYVRP